MKFLNSMVLLRNVVELAAYNCIKSQRRAITSKFHARYLWTTKSLCKPRPIPKESTKFEEEESTVDNNNTDVFGSESSQNVAEQDSFHKNGAEQESIIEDSLLHLRFVYVRTCQHHWGDIPIGLVFDVSYLDTHPNEDFDPAIKTILALHNHPGSPQDLLGLLQPLAEKGYRVIAPSFPGCGTSGASSGDDDAYTHGPGIHAQFIHDFLANLGITRIDLILADELACHTALRILGETGLARSALFVTPEVITYWNTFVRNWWAYNIHSSYEYLLMRPLAYIFACVYRVLLGYSRYSLKTVISYCKMRVHCSFDGIRGFISSLGILGFPIVIFSPKNWSRTEKRSFNAYKDILDKHMNAKPYPVMEQLDAKGTKLWDGNLDYFLKTADQLIQYGNTHDFPQLKSKDNDDESGLISEQIKKRQTNHSSDKNYKSQHEEKLFTNMRRLTQ